MFTAGEAAAVALGLMAARRLGLETDGALAKVRRVLPDRVRLRRRVARAHARLHRRASSAAPPDGETLLTLADAARRGRRVTRPLHRLAGRRDRSASSARTASSPTAAAGTSPPSTTPRGDLRALRADRIGDVRARRPGRAAPDGFDAVAFVSRTLARVPWAHEIEVLLHTDPASRCRASRPRSPSSSRPTTGTRPAHARRLARLGRRPARRRRLRLHRHDSSGLRGACAPAPNASRQRLEAA